MVFIHAPTRILTNPPLPPSTECSVMGEGITSHSCSCSNAGSLRISAAAMNITVNFVVWRILIMMLYCTVLHTVGSTDTIPEL